MKCEMCGREIEEKKRRRYCSEECGYEARKERERRARRKEREGGEKRCPVCGRGFESGYPRQKYCSKKCQIVHNNQRSRYLVEKRNSENRGYTEDTVYLVCKWKREGLGVKEIGEILGRSKENVQRALELGGMG